MKKEKKKLSVLLTVIMVVQLFLYAGGVQAAAPAAPTGVQAVAAADGGKMTLTWAGTSGNNYHVYRSTTGTGNFTKITASSLAGTSYDDTAVSPAVTYHYYVTALNAQGEESVPSSPTVAVTIPGTDRIPPTVPTGLAATAVSSVQINLAWQAGTDNIAVAGYNIYRKTGSGSYAKINTAPLAVTGYNDVGLSPGRTYTYQVATVDEAGNESAERAQVSRPTPVDNQAPAKPEGLTATASGLTRINLTWNAAVDNAGVAEYIIYRSTDNRNFTRIAKSTDRNHADTGLTLNTTYYYRVSAVDAAGNESVPSDIVSARLAVDTEKPTAPRIWAMAESTAKVKVSWSGAGDNVGVAEYDLYRAEGNGDFYRLAAATSAPYYDNNVSANKTYKYYIKARDTAGYTSDASNTVAVTTNGDTARPSAPRKLIYTMVSSTEVKLTWEAASDNKEVKGYHIYRAYEGGSYNYLAATVDTNYHDRGMTANKTYRYYVLAYDAAGNLSADSDIIAVYTSAAERTIDRGKSGYVELPGLARLDVPAEALSGDTTFKITGGNFNDYINTGYKVIGQPVRITARTGSSLVTGFNAGLTVTMYFNAAQLGGAEVNKLRIYYWEDDNDIWLPLPSTVYWSPQKVTAVTNHLTDFALLVDTGAPDKPVLHNWSTSTKRIVTLSGRAEAYAEVEIRLNGRLLQTTATGKGAFATEIMLAAGNNRIELRAKDGMGNHSPWSEEYIIKCTPDFYLNDIAGHWAEYNMQKALELGIAGGYKDRSFRPDRTVSRVEFARFVVSALGLSPENNPQLYFRDRKAIPAWAEGYVARAVETGIISGYSDGTFKPGREITREEMASILIRALRLQREAEIKNNGWWSFNDYPQIQSWARGAVAVAVEKGLIKGYADNTFGPARKATRAEAVTTIVKMRDNIK